MDHYDGTAWVVLNLGTKGLAAPATYDLSATVLAPDGSILVSHTVVIGLR
jgi:hypothetical protein